MMALAPVMAGAARRSVERIAAAEGAPVDFLAEMVTTTFDVISDVTFSGGEGFERHIGRRAHLRPECEARVARR